MSFQEHAIKTEYRSLIDNVVQKFYLPLLKEAVSYKRAVGFFSSSSLIEISKGIADLASRGGRIQIVASPYLSDDDIEAIKKGYADRDEVIEAALLGQLSDEHADYYSMERLNLLANLIANGVLDIRIAYTEDAKGIGMYHEKMGIIEDADGNKVAFSGSMNESSTAMSLNYETVDVFRSWYDEGESERVRLKENGTRIRFAVYEYDESKKGEDLDENLRLKSVVPFQLAYAVSIHKAQGLEYDSVKVIIPSNNAEKITHGIFYTAITRAKTNLKIYWSSETMHDVVKGFATDESKRKSLEIVKTKLGKN